MKSYCEEKTGKSINWYDRLEELGQLKKESGADSRKYLDTLNIYHADAARWVTCACGNMCSIIPRDNDRGFSGPGRPLDKELATLGGQFPMVLDDYDAAMDCLNKIEKRSGELIKEILLKEHAELHAE